MSGTVDPIRVLHVDDELGFTNLTQEFLERADDRIDVQTAASADEAQELLRNADIDCVVSDYDMPGRSGIEFLEAVRETRPDLPFILYTGKGSEEVAGEAISAGVTDYLQKGTGSEQYSILANRITNAVEKYRAQRRTETITRRFEAVLQNTTTPMFMKDDRGRYIFVNREYRDLFGLQEAEIVGRTDDEIHPPGVAAELRRNDATVIERGESTEIEETITVDGDERVFLSTKVPIYDIGTRSSDDEPLAVFGVATDITDRKRQTRRLETLISNVPGVVYRARNERGWPMELVRGDSEQLTGYTAAALQRGEVNWGEDVLHPDDRDRMWTNVQDAIETGDPFEVTYRIQTASGDTRWMWERGRAVESGADSESEPVALEGFITDITDRKERERELTAVERRYQTIFDDPNILIGRLDTDGTVLDVNRTALEYVDATAADVIGRPFPETPWCRQSTSSRAEIEAVIDRVASGEYAEFETEFTGSDGDSHTVDGVCRPVTGDDGVVQSILLSARDITDRVERQRELESQRDRYRSLFENNPLIIWEHDYSEAMAYLESITAGVDDVEAYLTEHPEALSQVADRIRTIDVNQAALSYYDAPSKQVLLDSIDEVMHEDGTEVFAKQLGAFAAGETRFRAETVSQTLSGDRHEEVIQVVVPEKSDDDYSRVYVIGTDITEQKQRERQIQRQNRRLDKFTSVVSHDLRNPLNIAASALELAADECDSPFLDDVADAHSRMERLIDDLLTFARAGSDAIDLASVDLPDRLDECWAMLRDDDASLTVETDATVRADPDRLRQLLRNLLANAVEHGSPSNRTEPDDAVEHGSTGSRAPPDDAVEHGGSGVSITVGDVDGGFYVADDGPGIHEGDAESVFGAGYSTTQEGTGFGLSIVQEVAEAHGWDVRVTESADGGARFEITGVERVS